MRLLTLISIFLWCACTRKTPDPPSNGRPPISGDTSKQDTTTLDTPVTPPVIPDTPVEFFVKPSTTDPLINTFLSNHFIAVQEKSNLKNILFVFLPGSYAQPSQYQGVVRKAAWLGYHGIGLMYPDDKPVNNFCANTNDTTCHRRARLEIVNGEDLSPNVSVDKPNSIINRLTKLVFWLNTNHPTEHWDQFIKGDSLDWTKVIMSGHSQGGGNAAVMGRYYPLKKVVMFSMMDWMNNGKTPDWENMTFNKGKYYDIFNPLDEDVPYAGAKLGWEHMEMTTSSSPAVNSDDEEIPFNHAHVLLTSHEPANSDGPKYHNSTAMDAYIQKDTSGNYVLDKQWEYLITAE